LEEAINALPLVNNELIKPGEFVFELYNSIGVTFDNASDLIKITENAITILGQGRANV
jgi:hypothetical protein